MFRPLIFVLALAAVAASEGRFTEKIQNFMKEKEKAASQLTDGKSSASESMLKQAASKKTSKREEYVTVEEFEEAITEIEADLSTVMAMVTQTNAMVQENTNLISDVYTELTGTTDALGASISSLENLYNTATVRKCYSGTIGNACGNTCNWEGQDKPSGYTTQVTFPAAFHTTPHAIATLYKYDDTDTSFRFVLSITPSTTGMSVNLKTWSNSRIYNASVRWMACA